MTRDHLAARAAFTTRVVGRSGPGLRRCRGEAFADGDDAAAARRRWGVVPDGLPLSPVQRDRARRALAAGRSCPPFFDRGSGGTRRCEGGGHMTTGRRVPRRHDGELVEARFALRAGEGVPRRVERSSP